MPLLCGSLDVGGEPLDVGEQWLYADSVFPPTSPYAHQDVGLFLFHHKISEERFLSVWLPNDTLEPTHNVFWDIYDVDEAGNIVHVGQEVGPLIPHSDYVWTARGCPLDGTHMLVTYAEGFYPDPVSMSAQVITIDSNGDYVSAGSPVLVSDPASGEGWSDATVVRMSDSSAIISYDFSDGVDTNVIMQGLTVSGNVITLGTPEEHPIVAGGQRPIIGRCTDTIGIIALSRYEDPNYELDFAVVTMSGADVTMSTPVESGLTDANPVVWTRLSDTKMIYGLGYPLGGAFVERSGTTISDTTLITADYSSVTATGYMETYSIERLALSDSRYLHLAEDEPNYQPSVVGVDIVDFNAGTTSVFTGGSQGSVPDSHLYLWSSWGVNTSLLMQGGEVAVILFDAWDEADDNGLGVVYFTVVHVEA